MTLRRRFAVALFLPCVVQFSLPTPHAVDPHGRAEAGLELEICGPAARPRLGRGVVAEQRDSDGAWQRCSRVRPRVSATVRRTAHVEGRVCGHVGAVPSVARPPTACACSVHRNGISLRLGVCTPGPVPIAAGSVWEPRGAAGWVCGAGSGFKWESWYETNGNGPMTQVVLPPQTCVISYQTYHSSSEPLGFV